MSEWLSAGAAIALLAYAIVIYNLLVRDRQRTLAGWSDIEVQLKRRHDLIPKLVDAVRQYAAYEQSTLERVTALRNEAREIRDAAAQGELESGISRGPFQRPIVTQDELVPLQRKKAPLRSLFCLVENRKSKL